MKKSQYEVPFKIDKSVPFPAFWRAREIKYPINIMKVGDSFVIRKNINKSPKHLFNAKNLAKCNCVKWNKIPDKKFYWEIQEDVIRIWRIK